MQGRAVILYHMITKIKFWFLDVGGEVQEFQESSSQLFTVSVEARPLFHGVRGVNNLKLNLLS